VNRAALVCLLAATAALLEGQSPAKNRHVVLISIDGFAAYALKNPDVAVPNIRELIRNGVAAEGMQPVNPTVTWPNHTSMVTGVTPAKHSVLFNGAPIRGGEGEPVRVEPYIPKDELVSGETLYDVARKAGLTTAEVDWVAIEKAPNINWSFAEWPSVEGSVEREMIAAGLVTPDEIRGFTKRQITWRDEIWTRAGEHILTAHKPNLLLFHLLTTDSAQHQYGARSLAGNTALALADARVGRLIEATRRAGIYERATFVIVSDHGFKTVKRLIRPNALLTRQGLGKSAWVIPEGGTAMVYVTRTPGKAETAEKLKAMFADLEGVSRVLVPSDFAEYGYPDPASNQRMADLVLAAADGYAFHGAAEGEPVAAAPEGATPGTHGYLNTEPEMDAIFIASGAGIKRAVSLGKVRNIDIAPTIARLLGVTLARAEGAVLESILD
jgi:predicted AlkP superfamily pyrophosphatase or phosphodiesterase